ncbi:hypothetical protein RDABS01_029117 [Bienertia sinuspersici]
MASAKPYLTILSLLFIFLSLFPSLSLSESSSSPSVFEILPKYGLPSGLLPDCVKNYTLSHDTGHFVVDLEHTCYIKFDYLVYYEKRITGTLKIGSISDLKGIQVKKFFVWLNLDEVQVDLPPSGSIYFQIGIINKKLSVHQFETVRSCRDETSASYGQLRPWNLIFELPPPVDQEMSMLLTE